MAERDGYIPGVPCRVDTSQPDPEAAVAFYRELFGSEAAPAVAAWNTYVWVLSADEAAAKVLEAGGHTLREPFDVTDAGRTAVFADPEGAAFNVWQAGRHRGARIVNEPAALNFNGLNTRDVEAARKFYGSVFGWRTLTIGDAELWTLPGYGDHLEERDPGLHKRTAELGAPGFEDVVASLDPMRGDRPDVPAHWSVTFATDDADALAAKAAELGGSVLMPPLDVPWARLTVIADPQGASFIASKFVPENRG